MAAECDAKQVLYLYGVLPRRQDLPEKAGISLLPIPHLGLLALTEPVPASEFSPDVLEEKLQSIEWVARLARRHEAVLEAAMQKGPMIPARLCTLFSSTEAVKSSLAEREELFLCILERLQGRQEWGLKIFCDEKELERATAENDQAASALAADAAAENPGRSYILSKMCAARAAEAAAACIDDSVEEMLGALDPVPAEVCILPLLPGQAYERGETMVLNMAALMSEEELRRFKTTIKDLASRFGRDGFTFELSGPWPAYSFVDESLGAEENSPS